jgi:hypothetical protein
MDKIPKLNFANGVTLIRYGEEFSACEFSNIVRDGAERPEEKHYSYPRTW